MEYVLNKVITKGANLSDSVPHGQNNTLDMRWICQSCTKTGGHGDEFYNRQGRLKDLWQLSRRSGQLATYHVQKGMHKWFASGR
jgi:hypothetical protein